MTKPVFQTDELKMYFFTSSPCHFDEIFDCGVRLLGDILKGVLSLHQTAEYETGERGEKLDG